MTSLRISPLDNVHRSLGAKLVEFGGWDMPVSYPAGTIEEHRLCRGDAVVFDVSHLGTVRVVGPSAYEALQAAFSNDLAKIGPGRAQYTHLLDANDGSVLDDIIVWWCAENEHHPEQFDVMPNASNTDRVVSALLSYGLTDLTIDDITPSRAVLAVQGPLARSRLAAVSPEAAEVPRFRVADVDILGVQCRVAGTGYTGEDGVEIAVPSDAAENIWAALLGAGILPAGLGARDTLRLEAGLPLHGHELGAGITPYQANLGWVVATKKGPFRGSEALEHELSGGVRRKLVGLSLEGRQPAREGSVVLFEGNPVGTVSSGNFSPTLGHAIALAFVDAVAASAVIDAPGAWECDVRGRRLPARLTSLPFVAKK